MMMPLRFAIVGTGAIASAYEAAFSRLELAKVTAVCDVRYSAAQNFAQRFGCDAYASPDYLVRYGNFDAAVICTPPATHESVATLLLNHGKHVLCEKPLATTVPSAWRMLEAARRNNVVLTMASKF